MGKALGIVSLNFGIIGVIIIIFGVINIIFGMFIIGDVFLAMTLIIIFFVSSIVAIVCGGIGIKKDDSPGLAIAGLALGSINPILLVFSSIILMPIILLF